MSRNGLSALLRSFGPGLLYAGAAIGVSHLIQSTRAGAEYAWWPAIGIVLIHCAKYPFFEMGPRYAMATGESLIRGYQRISWWALLVFALLTLGTMFAIVAAIISVSAGITAYVFGLEWSHSLTCAFILILCTAVLLYGKYAWLDRLMKVIIVLLSLTTIIALGMALAQGRSPEPVQWNHLLSGAFLGMLIKLMGWMPAPLDISVWHSLWVLKKKAAMGGDFSVKESRRDFQYGYWGTMVLGLAFLGMGAYGLRGMAPLPGDAIGFSKALIGMYTLQLGPGAFAIVSVAAVATMCSTAITVLDAIPRSLKELWLCFSQKGKKRLYPAFLIFLSAGSFILLHFYSAGMVALVDLATVLSFSATPVLAYLNLRAMRFLEQSGNAMALKPSEKIRALVAWWLLLALFGLYLFWLFSP